MPKYVVEVREVWVQKREIEADNPNEAIQKVKNGEGEDVENGMEYSHTLEDYDNWGITVVGP
jgi:hypothetical protein